MSGIFLKTTTNRAAASSHTMGRFGVKALTLTVCMFCISLQNACIQNKLATPNLVRTGQGDSSRYLDTEAVTTESGAPAVCLYSVQGSPSAGAGSRGTGSAGAVAREQVNAQALDQAELLSALQTNPGIDNIRQAVVSELLAPLQIALFGAASVTAGKLISAGTAVGDNAAGSPAAGATRGVSNTDFLGQPDRQKLAAGYLALDKKQRAIKAETSELLRRSGFTIDTQGKSGLALKEWINGKSSYDDFAYQIRGWAAVSGDRELGARVQAVLNDQSARLAPLNRDLELLRSAAIELRQTRAPGEAVQRALPRFEALQKELSEAVSGKATQAAAGQAVTDAVTSSAENGKNVAQAGRSARKTAESLGGSLKNWCVGTEGDARRLAFKTAFCAAGAVALVGGSIWGTSTLIGNAGKLTINTDSVKAALAADARTRPDVVVDEATYELLVAGIRDFSSTLMARPDMSTRPNCPL